MKHKRLFNILSYIEDMICVLMIMVGIELIILNLTPNMPIYGLVLLLLGFIDAVLGNLDEKK